MYIDATLDDGMVRARVGFSNLASLTFHFIRFSKFPQSTYITIYVYTFNTLVTSLYIEQRHSPHSLTSRAPQAVKPIHNTCIQTRPALDRQCNPQHASTPCTLSTEPSKQSKSPNNTISQQESPESYRNT